VLAGRRNARRDFRSVTHCIAIPMQARTQWTNSDLWLQLATRPECSFEIGDRQSEKKWWNRDRRAICNAMRGIEAGRRVICHWGVSNGSDGVRPLWPSQSARTEMFFADVSSRILSLTMNSHWLSQTSICSLVERFPLFAEITEFYDEVISKIDQNNFVGKWGESFRIIPAVQ